MNAATVARLEGRLLEAWSAKVGEGAVRAGSAAAVQTDYEGRMRVLSLEDGHVVAEDRLELPGSDLPLPAFDREGGFRVVSGTTVRAYDERGGLQWSTPLPEALNRQPSVAPDGTCYVHGKKEIHALDADGGVLWSRPLERRSSWDTPVVAPDGNLIVETKDGAVVAFTPDGTEAWRNEDYTRQRPGDLTPLATRLEMLPDGSVCFVTVDGDLHLLGPDGKERWNREIKADPLDGGSPEVDGQGNIYISKRGSLLAFDAEGRDLFTRDFSGEPYPHGMPEGGVAVWVPREGLRVLDAEGNEEGRFEDEGSGHVSFLGQDDLLWKDQGHVRRLMTPEGWPTWEEAHPPEDLRIEEGAGSLTIGSIRLDVRS